ncbi:hypothetical protein HY948_00085, partial [Candidatus Gottesmanbacteria bacterium]|nr:hypothetical protein [Candidatus Gottesmanbacteria bacterium]
NGSITASVQRVETYSRGSSDFDMYLTLSINGIRNTKTGTLSYNGKIIEVGAPLELRLSDAQIMSQVIDDNVPPAGYNTKQIEAKIRFRNAEVWMISNIKVGDTMTSGPQGKTVATITAIATEPAQGSLIFTDTATRGGRASTGSVIIEQNNRLRDLLLTAILTIEQHNGEWFFGGHQNIKAGNLIWLYLPNVNVKGAEIETVTELPAHETKQK